MPDPRLSPCEQEAIRWCVARHSGEWSAADDVRLAAWLAAAEANRQAYQRVARAWRVAGGLSGTAVPVRRSPFRQRRAAAWTTVIVAVLAPFLAWEGGRWWNGVPQTFSTARGELRTLTLADGSAIHLDADSEAVVRVGHGNRSADLLRGAAYFVISHDEARPFEVKAGQGSIVDLGTRFDVDIRAMQVRVEVFEGRVALRTATGEAELAAGHEAGYDAQGSLGPVAALADPAPAWREGRLVFREEPLGEVVQRVARYHPVRFEFADPALAGLRISGVFRAGDLDGLLRTLEAGFPIRASRRGGDRIVLARAVPPK